MSGDGELWERVQKGFDRLKGAAEAFDAAAWRMVTSLIERARELADGSRDRLADRALQRMNALEKESFEASKRARSAIDEVHRRGGDPDDALTAFEEGRFKAALRLARGALLVADHARNPRARAQLARMTQEARARGARLPGPLERDLKAMVDGKPSLRPPELSSALSATLFRQSAGAMRAVVTAARAAENLPEVVGPYNPVVLSAKTLEQLADLSPGYLGAFVQRIEALRALQRLAEPSQKEDPHQPRTRKGKRGATSGGKKKTTVKILPKSEDKAGAKKRPKKAAAKAPARAEDKIPAKKAVARAPKKKPSGSAT